MEQQSAACRALTQGEKLPGPAAQRAEAGHSGGAHRDGAPFMIRSALLVLSLAFPATGASFKAVDAQERPLAITGGILIDGTGAPARPGVTILLEGGRITGILPKGHAALPAGIDIMDATGKFIIPGLADMHTHFGAGGLLRSDSITTGRALRQFLFYGVTTVLNLGATEGSLEDILALRKRERGGHLPAPTIYATGGLLTIPGSHPIATIMEAPEGADPAAYDWSQRGVWVVRSPDEVRTVVARLAAAGMDGIKVVIESGPDGFGDHPQMPPELVEAAVQEAHRRGLPVFAHATSPDELEVAVRSGVHAVVHLVGPAPVSEDLLATMREREIFYVPTLSLFVWADAWGDAADALTDPFLTQGVQARVRQSLLTSPMAPSSPPGEEDWTWRRAVLRGLKTAHDAGVPIVAGTDTNNPFVFPGYSIHHELALMVEAGLTPMEALEAATRRTAELIGHTDEFGTIEPGKRADLLVLGANPLEDILNTRTLEVVIQRGRVIDRSAILAAE